MTHTNSVLDRVALKLDALKALFGTTEDHLEVDLTTFKFDRDIVLDTVFQNKNSAVSLVQYTRAEISHPLHSHSDLMEYLIVTDGTFALKTNSFVRVMKKGDCASIPPGLQHTTICLEDTGELLAICIPPESAYTREGVR
jgi:quercetin dioxygenase-like cupin family protein